MAIEIDAYDGGQVHRLRLGEAETLVWRLHDLPSGDSLSSSSHTITGSAAFATQTFILDPEVGYRVTAIAEGSSDLEVTLNTSLGDIYKHRLIIKVFT